ncbi:hypothetical protein F4781DRAFT_410020 [Annulohypoxylon bovei var. microspora]|nr:hypothetical protein F4781DRAFT_410020 [Annulohypoxylon bovei var. microspora]
MDEPGHPTWLDGLSSVSGIISGISLKVCSFFPHHPTRKYIFSVDLVYLLLVSMAAIAPCNCCPTSTRITSQSHRSTCRLPIWFCTAANDTDHKQPSLREAIRTRSDTLPIDATQQLLEEIFGVYVKGDIYLATHYDSTCCVPTYYKQRSILSPYDIINDRICSKSGTY